MTNGPGEPGDPVRIAMTKWGEHPHWRFDGVLLGSDAHGDWIGFPAGTHHERPGVAVTTEVAAVTLVPREGAFLATFHDPGTVLDTYVDIATPAVWDGPVLRSVDLDLDVIRLADGRVYVDDEDEFAEHQVSLGYPPDVIALATASCDRVLAAVTDRTGPFDGGAAAWLARVGATDRPAEDRTAGSPGGGPPA